MPIRVIFVICDLCQIMIVVGTNVVHTTIVKCVMLFC